MKNQALILLLAAFSAFGQGTFVNLDFESATITPVPNSPFMVYAAAALPGWTAYIGITPVSSIYYDAVTLGDAAVSIHDTHSTRPVPEGEYMVVLQPNFPSASLTAAVGQTGQIPQSAKSVQFYGTQSYTLSFAGNQIPLAAIGSGPNYTVFGGNVSSFAGQTGELRITGLGFVDNIVFSSTAVPEPSILTLSALGTVLLIWRFLRFNRSITAPFQHLC